VRTNEGTFADEHLPASWMAVGQVPVVLPSACWLVGTSVVTRRARILGVQTFGSRARRNDGYDPDALNSTSSSRKVTTRRRRGCRNRVEFALVARRRLGCAVGCPDDTDPVIPSTYVEPVQASS